MRDPEQALWSSFLKAVSGQASIDLIFPESTKGLEAAVTEVQILPSMATQGIQLQLIAPSGPPSPTAVSEPKGVVYTKRWVVDLLLDLSGYEAAQNLVDALAVEPAAGDGAFLGPMIERLIASCQRLGRPLLECESSLIAYELDESSAARARALTLSILEGRGVSRSLAERLAQAWVVS